MTYTRKLNLQKHTDTIRWIGRDTRGLYRWIAYGESFESIWNATVDGGVNHAEAEEEYRLWKIGKSEDDFEDAETGEIDYDEMDKVIWNVTMTEEDYRDLIMKSRGNAYYSEFAYYEFGEDKWIEEDEEPIYILVWDDDKWGSFAHRGQVITTTELKRLASEWGTTVSELEADLNRIN